jgi:opacity protein-like surface antigen
VKKYAMVVLFGAMLLALASSTALATDGGRFAIGGYGGYQWPIAQDDADPGALFGFKGKLALGSVIELEPNVTWIQNGDTTTNSGGEIPAPEVISFALNANLTLGADFNVTGGLGWASLDLPNTGAQNKFAWNAGFGVEIPVGPLAIDISPRLLVIGTESGASRKHGLVRAGLNYRF